MSASQRTSGFSHLSAASVERAKPAIASRLAGVSSVVQLVFLRVNWISAILMIGLLMAGQAAQAWVCSADAECRPKDPKPWCWSDAAGCAPVISPPPMCVESSNPSGFLDAQSYADFKVSATESCTGGIVPGSGVAYPNPDGTEVLSGGIPAFRTGSSRPWLLDYRLLSDPNMHAIFGTTLTATRGYSCPEGWFALYDGNDVHCERARTSCQNSCPAGNPVMPMEQSKLETVADFTGAGGLSLIRRYNSASRAVAAADAPVAFGPKWSSNWEGHLKFDAVDMVRAIRPEGEQIQFTPQAGLWRAWSGEASTLTEFPGATGDQVAWALRDAQDRIESDRADGKLLRIETRDGESFVLAYDA
ncbi:MAG: hypothetical protein IT478_05555, partial [Xanthomonadales bacterium]|nr:hypothetical protein [Xanthomonadales bacterium]